MPSYDISDARFYRIALRFRSSSLQVSHECFELNGRLIKLSSVLTGHMRGGLAQVNVMLSTLMGGVSGSAIADAAMESAHSLPCNDRKRIFARFTANCTAWTGLITATIPPGVGIILYGVTGEVSIGRLFAAGIFVGIFLTVVYMFTVWVISGREGYKAERARASFRECVQAIVENIWAAYSSQYSFL